MDTDLYYSGLLNFLKNQMWDICAVELIEKIGMKSDLSFDIYGKNVLSFSFSSNRFKETKSIS